MIARNHDDWTLMLSTKLRRRAPIAVNLYSPGERFARFIAHLHRMSIVEMDALDQGAVCPFLIDYGLSLQERIHVWRAVWDARTLVRTARLITDEESLLVRPAAGSSCDTSSSVVGGWWD